jgi:DNA-binding GntR family transcriptional regulator
MTSITSSIFQSDRRDINRTLAEGAINAIKEMILDGTLRSGQRLQLEQLAEALQLSQTPIREALRRLEQLGLVEHIPHIGAHVVPLSVAELYDLYTTRIALEPLAVEKAASRFSEELYRRGKESLARLKAAQKNSDQQGMWKAHEEFHFLLYSTSGSPWLLRSIKPLWERAQCYRSGYEELMNSRMGEHAQILTACQRGKVEEAHTLTHNHLARMGNRMIEILGDCKEKSFILKTF